MGWKKSYLIIIAAVAALSQSPAFARDTDISSLVNEKRPIRTFVKGFVIEPGGNRVKPEDFKACFEKALSNRKSVTFEVVKDATSSDVEISGIVKGYRYMKDDPINSFAGAGALILDAATSENFAEMKVEFTVVDSKTGKILWKDSVSSFLERPMTEEESLPLVYDKVSRAFLSKCFGKPR